MNLSNHRHFRAIWSVPFSFITLSGGIFFYERSVFWSLLSGLMGSVIILAAHFLWSSGRSAFGMPGDSVGPTADEEFDKAVEAIKARKQRDEDGAGQKP